MKKIGDIMSEMGFNKDSSESTQKAFLKYLVRTRVGLEIRDESAAKFEQTKGQQLEFSFLQEISNKPKAG